LFFILTFVSVGAGAGELPAVAVRSLTLAQAESLWQQANPELLPARSTVAMTDADRLAADRGNNPQVSSERTLLDSETGNMPARNYQTSTPSTENDSLNYSGIERKALKHGSPIPNRTVS
jgi:hypothetical protein